MPQRPNFSVTQPKSLGHLPKAAFLEALLQTSMAVPRKGISLPPNRTDITSAMTTPIATSCLEMLPSACSRISSPGHTVGQGHMAMMVLRVVTVHMAAPQKLLRKKRKKISKPRSTK